MGISERMQNPVKGATIKNISLCLITNEYAKKISEHSNKKNKRK